MNCDIGDPGPGGSGDTRFHTPAIDTPSATRHNGAVDNGDPLDEV